MLQDLQAKLSVAQALTATADSTNYYDTLSDYDISRGEPLGLVVTVVAAADTASGNETYSFALETDDNSSFSSGTILASKTIAGADLTTGSVHVIPFHAANAERYLQGTYTLGGTTPSVTVTAELKALSDVSTWTSNQPSGYTVNF